MDAIGLLASIGVIAGALGFLFWQARRAASSADECLAAVKRSGELELALAARGNAVEDRDRTIEHLEAERKRGDAALAEALAQRDQLVANLKDPHAAVSAIRDALALHGVLPDVPQAAAAHPAAPAPHR
jgi:hypothetical protein